MIAEMPTSHEEQANKQLNERLSTSEHYQAEEVLEIQKLSRKLFPLGYELDQQDTDAFRALCRLSQIDLRPVAAITSHRRIIGPVIVAMKKISRPFVLLIMRNILEGIQEFASWVVFLLAQHHVLLKRSASEQRAVSMNDRLGIR